MSLILVCDIGGTNSRLNLFDIKENKISISKTYKTNDFHSLTEIVNDFLNQIDSRIEKGIFSIAGPIETLELSNSNLKIDKQDLVFYTSLSDVHFLNDFEANAYGIISIDKEKLKTINSAKGLNKNFCVIGPGTGLGMCVAHFNLEDNKYFVINSEGSHKDFPIDNDYDFKLLNFAKQYFSKSRIEYDDIVSGRGIEMIYKYLTDKELTAKEISKSKLKDEFAKKTFDLFYKYLARACKNLVLESDSFGGVYITGHIVNSNKLFSKKEFLFEFTDSTHFKEELSNVPIYIVKDEEIAIEGSINHIIH